MGRGCNDQSESRVEQQTVSLFSTKKKSELPEQKVNTLQTTENLENKITVAAVCYLVVNRGHVLCLKGGPAEVSGNINPSLSKLTLSIIICCVAGCFMSSKESYCSTFVVITYQMFLQAVFIITQLRKKWTSSLKCISTSLEYSPKTIQVPLRRLFWTFNSLQPPHHCLQYN